MNYSLWSGTIKSSAPQVFAAEAYYQDYANPAHGGDRKTKTPAEAGVFL